LASLPKGGGAKSKAEAKLWQQDLLKNYIQAMGDEMKTFKMYNLALIALIGVMITGCAPMAITGSADVNKTAFGAKKKFAVVSINSTKTFQGEQSISQQFTSNDKIAGTNTQPILDKLSPKIINSLGKSKHFTLVPERTVLASKAYKNLMEDDKSFKIMFIPVEMNAANNYKYLDFSDEKKFAKLAKDLGVDGVIDIRMNFSIVSSGWHVAGFGKKSYSSTVGITAIAYNKDGTIIWKDSTMKEAEPGDTRAIILIDPNAFNDTNFEKFHPSAVEIGSKAVDVLLARFDDTISGKGTSMFQSFK
jgi:hypothetical protein